MTISAVLGRSDNVVMPTTLRRSAGNDEFAARVTSYPPAALAGGLVMPTERAEPRVLLDGLAMVESARWHDGRLWFAHWGTGEIVAVDLDGKSEVMAEGRPGLGWSIDWLPDGRLLVTGEDLLRQDADGSMVQHADLTTVAKHGWNEVVVDGRGNIYLNGFDFDFLGGAAPKPGIVALVTPDGAARQVADGIEFPNGMVVSPDNSTLVIAESFASRLTAFDIGEEGSLSNRRVWAEGIGPDGICMDAEGAIWTGSSEVGVSAFIRVLEGGEIVECVPLDRAGFSCMLGGPDGRTLFMLAAEWRGVEGVNAVLAARTGQVLVADAPAPGAGWP
jgi:sugar lactone lactonase YvrE